MKRVLVTGRTGQVARALSRLSGADFTFVTLGRPELDLADPASIERAIEDVGPFALVNAAAYTAVDKAESEPERAFAVNRDGAGLVAAAAARRGIPVLQFSTDYVFAGDKAGPYLETDPVAPASVYGRSKAAGEEAVMASNPAHVVLRTAWVYSADGANFVATMLRLAKDRDRIRVVADQQGTPTYAPDIADGVVAVLRRIDAAPDSDTWRGIFNLVAEGDTNWADFARTIFAQSARYGGPVAEVEPITTADYPTPARRPANSRLGTTRFRTEFSHALPPWQDGVRRCVAAMQGGGESTI